MTISISFSLGDKNLSCHCGDGSKEQTTSEEAQNQTTWIKSILDSINWKLAAIIGNSLLIVTNVCGILIYCWKRFAHFD